MTKGKNSEKQEFYKAGYNINRYPTERTKQLRKNKWDKITQGINNAEVENAYSCYINATFQLLASNIPFVREVLDFMVSHKIILTENVREASKTTNMSFDDELEHMRQYPTLALFLLMMKISRVIKFRKDKNINLLVFKFYRYIIEKLNKMDIAEKQVLYPENKYKSVEEKLAKINKAQDMEKNIAYMLPVIFHMIQDNNFNHEIPPWFSPPIFSQGSELVPFLEFFLQNMKMELDKLIPHRRIQAIANPVDTQYKLVVHVSLYSGNGEEIKK